MTEGMEMENALKNSSEVFISDELPAFSLRAVCGTYEDQTQISWDELFSAQIGRRWQSSAVSNLCGGNDVAVLLWRDERIALVLFEADAWQESSSGHRETSQHAECRVYRRQRSG